MIEKPLAEFDPRGLTRSIKPGSDENRGPADGSDSSLSATCYRTIDAANEKQWNNVVTQSDRGTIFHRYE